MYANRQNFPFLKETGVKEHDGDVRFSTEVEIWPFRTCTMKNMQYGPYVWPNPQNCRVTKEIGVEEHDGGVRF